MDAIDNEYHRERLAMIARLIPRGLLTPGKKVVDFGCGDAVMFPPFLEHGVEIRGLDISPAMVKTAKDRLRSSGYDEGLVEEGGVHALKRVEAASQDALISFNVLAYLTTEEETIFYEEASRIVRPGGLLIVTHSNDLFDLYALNRYTAEFFSKHFGVHGAESLLAHPDLPLDHLSYNVRENPLSYRYKLDRYGFREIAQDFANYHTSPPLLAKNRTYPDTSRVPDEHRWKLMFMCSMFGVTAEKR